ncbi:hypothetical protein ACLOJK_007883 [Asimina triloba]
MYADYGALPEHLLWCSIAFINGRQPWLSATPPLRLIGAIQKVGSKAGIPDLSQPQPVTTVDATTPPLLFLVPGYGDGEQQQTCSPHSNRSGEQSFFLVFQIRWRHLSFQIRWPWQQIQRSDGGMSKGDASSISIFISTIWQLNSTG